MQKLILIGGGGHCLSVIDAIESAQQYEIIGVLDQASMFGNTIAAYSIVGTDEDIAFYIQKNVKFVLTIGHIKSPALRIKLYDKVITQKGLFATIISAKATLAKTQHIGESTVVLHHAVVNTAAHIGKNCIINTGAIIEHNAIIGNHTHISTGAIINGDCTIGSGCFVGSGTILKNGITVGDNIVIGAASYINKNLTEPGIYVGNPCKLISKNA
jgi:sugar O-acyltransferase (sialic acid O-acetyltransferase NeuD family)